MTNFIFIVLAAFLLFVLVGVAIEHYNGTISNCFSKTDDVGYLERFNTVLLSGKMGHDEYTWETYTNLFEAIKRTKLVDKSKMLNDKYQTVKMDGWEESTAYCPIFLDNNNNFRLADSGSYDRIKDPRFVEKCLTLDEIEQKLPLEQLVEEEKKHNKMKAKSDAEWRKISDFR